VFQGQYGQAEKEVLMKRAQRVCACLVAVALLGSGAGPARADIIFNNFGPGDGYDTSQGWQVGASPLGGPRLEQATAFTPTGASFTFDQVAIALSRSGFSTGPNLIDVALTTSSGGAPGTVLETFRFVGAMGLFGLFSPPLVADSVLHPLLLEGTQYWLVASVPQPTTLADWNLASPVDLGRRAFREVGGPWQVADATVRGAFRVSGTPVGGTAVPEPTALTLLSSGVVGLLGHAWRRARHRSARAAVAD
jgi:hypothetical protein